MILEVLGQRMSIEDIDDMDISQLLTVGKDGMSV